MLKREEYIKLITSSLVHFQNELEMNNAAGLFDGNRTAEDFICGLLNLIYGCSLKNQNHMQKNAVAVDLADKTNRLAVQITSDNSHSKIQSTLDLFISHELYRDYDQLFVFLLKDRKSYRTPFKTNGNVYFSAERHIIDICGLIQKISTLDTATLKKINAYLHRELGDGLWNRKWRILLHVTICLMLAAFLILTVGASFWSKPTSKVYLSKLQPYTETGLYESYEDVSPVYQTEIEALKAFSILSFVRCDSSSSSRIEDVSCRILDLEPIEEPDLILDAYVVDNTLKLFAFNNGWGTAKASIIEMATIYWQDNTEPLTQITNNARFSEKPDVAPASALLLAEFDLDGAKFQELQKLYCDTDEAASLSIQVHGENCSGNLFAYLNFNNDNFYLFSGGRDNSDTSDITLFAMLDVDKSPSYVTFTGADATPRVENTIRVETVLAPTKSCIIKCQNVFFIDGKAQETDVYTAKVTVPAFKDFSCAISNSLTVKLASLDNFSEPSARQILEKYLYDPSILQIAKKTGG